MRQKCNNDATSKFATNTQFSAFKRITLVVFQVTIFFLQREDERFIIPSSGDENLFLISALSRRKKTRQPSFF